MLLSVSIYVRASVDSVSSERILTSVLEDDFFDYILCFLADVVAANIQINDRLVVHKCSFEESCASWTELVPPKVKGQQ